MTRKAPLALSPSIRVEFAFVVAATAVGALIRIWALGRLGLVHFDEGVYAISGLWAINPQGFSGLEPMVVPYAPPGFPFLVGLAYKLLGPSDVAAILVSVTTGVLAVPAAAWLARRTFGAGAGAAAAALTAASGFHVAFSRMALTDASFLLCWLVGLIVAQRFLERPAATTGVALGIAVGVAQLFKYSGWTLGVVDLGPFRALESAQDVIGGLPFGSPADADPEPGVLVGPEMGGDVAQPLLASIRASPPDPDLADGEVQVVAHHKDVGRVQLVEPDGLADGPAAQVHERVGLEHQDPAIVDLDLGEQPLELAGDRRRAPGGDEPIHQVEADVVPGSVVFGAGIPQPHHEFQGRQRRRSRSRTNGRRSGRAGGSGPISQPCLFPCVPA